MTRFITGLRPEIAAVLEQAAAEKPLTAHDMYVFEHTTSSELLALLSVADTLRARYHGSTTCP